MENEQVMKDLINELVKTVREGRERDQKILENHREQLKANRDAIAGLMDLVSRQNAAFNVTREVVARLFEDRYGSEGAEIPQTLPN